MSSKYTKTMAEAYQEVQEMDLKRGLKGFTDMLGGAAKHGLKALQAGAGGIKGGAEQAEKIRTGNSGSKAKTSGGETEEERAARRRAVGLEGNAGADRAKESQAAAKPKIDAANQARRDNAAAGRTSSNLPKDYKETEAKAFEKADKFRPGAGTSSLPKPVQREVRSAAGTAPKQPKPLDTSKVGSGTSNFTRTPKPVTPKPSGGGGMKRRPTGRSEMRSANIARTQQRSRPATVKPMASTSRLDSATSGIKPMADQYEFKALADAYDKMYQLDELFPGIAGGAGAAIGGALGLGGAAGAGTAGAIKGKDTKDKVKKAIGSGTGAAVGGALGGPIGAVIGGGIGDAVTEGNDMSGAPNVGKPKPTGQKTDVKYDKKMGVMAPNVKGVKEQAEAAYEAWLQEQITAGKNYNSSGLDLRSPGQKMDNIKKSVQQNDKIQGLIQPPKGL